MSSCTSVAVWSISTTAPSLMALVLRRGKSLADSNSKTGRIRLPPPARRCSPISVMARTLEHRIAAKLALNRGQIVTQQLENFFRRRCAPVNSKVSFIISSVVRKLHINAKVVAAQQCNNFLQRVAVFAAHPHHIPLDRGLHFFL